MMRSARSIARAIHSPLHRNSLLAHSRTLPHQDGATSAGSFRWTASVHVAGSTNSTITKDDSSMDDRFSSMGGSRHPTGSSSETSLGTLYDNDCVRADLLDYSGRQPTPIQLENILAMRAPADIEPIIQQELPVRLANRIAHLDTLPDLDLIDEFLSVRSDFLQTFSEVRRAPGTEEIAAAVRSYKIRSKHHYLRITLGMKKWKAMQNTSDKESADKVGAFVNSFLDRLFLSRIGMETLTSQYLALFNNQNGIVDPQCDPCHVCRVAVTKVSALAKAHLRAVPKIDIVFHGTNNKTLPLIPKYLFYIVVELLKNSIRAVGELHEAQGHYSSEPGHVRIRVSSDESQVAFQISDRGGGIPFERQPHVWSYTYSTAKGNRVCEKTGIILEESAQPTHLAGYGVGLPLSRLYAEYLGGSMHLMSMPNFGTHAYLFLQQSTDRKEALPTYVNWLRRRRLQEDIVNLEAKEREAASLRDYAEALRLKTLATEASIELASLDSVHV